MHRLKSLLLRDISKAWKTAKISPQKSEIMKDNGIHRVLVRSGSTKKDSYGTI